MDIAYQAMIFAREAHSNQRRKYSGNPYADHLAEVAGITATVDSSPSSIAVAWLHDCVEDQDVTGAKLEELFGPVVAEGVLALSDLEKGNRTERKAASRQRLSAAPAWVQTIKCADLISNIGTIVIHDPDFSRVFLREARLLLDVMTQADRRLADMAYRQIRTARLADSETTQRT